MEGESCSMPVCHCRESCNLRMDMFCTQAAYWTVGYFRALDFKKYSAVSYDSTHAATARAARLAAREKGISKTIFCLHRNRSWGLHERNMSAFHQGDIKRSVEGFLVGQVPAHKGDFPTTINIA